MAQSLTISEVSAIGSGSTALLEAGRVADFRRPMLETPRASQGSIAVFLSCNESYAAQACVAIKSAASNAEGKLHFFILSKGLSNFAVSAITACAGGREFVDFWSVQKSEFSECPRTISHIGEEGLFRLLIPERAVDMQKAVYLDCDVIVRDDLTRFFEIDISGLYAAVIDDIMPLNYSKLLGVERYFNSGVMLMNFERMRAEKLSIAFREECKERRKYLDQDVLNLVFKGRVKYAPLRWNASAPLFRKNVLSVGESDGERLEAVENPAIVHFTGPDKPWIIPRGITAHPYTPEWLHWLSLTPYAFQLKKMHEKFDAVSRLFWYWGRHLNFFMRPHFYKMRKLYRANALKYGN